ncbi:hypothetical protein [Methanosarcina barkeri]|nr:hypothetical protein [Methanosarcina barkeri]
MTLAIEWAEKYRPQTLKEIVGNKKAVQDLRTWLRSGFQAFQRGGQ